MCRSRFGAQALLVLLVLAGAACQAARESASLPVTSEATWIDLAGYRQRLAAERGRVVVVNFWATWCEPCREEFPALIRLHRRYAARDLTLLSISLDAPHLRDTAVKQFLAEQRPTFPVFVKTAGDADAFINAIEPSWSGALPATLIYNRTGARQHFLLGQQTLAELEARIRPLL